MSCDEQFNLEDLKEGLRVRYIGGIPEDECLGTVSSFNEWYAFVKFDEQVARHGWGGTTAQAVRLNCLEKV